MRNSPNRPLLAAAIALCLQASAKTPSPVARSGSKLDLKIAALERTFPIVQHGRVGFKFVEISTGRTLAERDAQTFFTPASNTKLYTTACALERLGENYKFRTELRTSGVWKPGQTRLNDLILVGGGDPDLSGRLLPYQPNSDDTDPLKAMKTLADELYNAGVREIRGDVSATGNRYPGDAFPDGWTLDDSDYGYGAPISALSVNDNLANIFLRPSAEGDLADVELQPAGSHFLISNQVVTVPGNKTQIKFRRPGHGNLVVLTGTIGLSANQWREELAVGDPELWAAECLISALRERGISVSGEARPQSVTLTSIPGTSILVHESAPLNQIVQVVNKVSQNLHAEMLLREVAFVRTHSGTLESALKQRQAFLIEAGLPQQPPSFAFADGSGLARQDLTTPESTTRLLLYMWSRPEKEAWLQSLPIGGLDGSLQKRFKKIADAQKVHAKTGSLSHVNALSGYIETESRGWLAFSIMANGTVGREAEVRDFLDKLCALFIPL